MILAGDVGGTKTRLALYEPQAGGKLVRTQVERFSSREAKSLDDIVLGFLAKHKASPDSACFGIPGPVIKGRVKTTNLPWQLFDQDLQRSLNIRKVTLVNDLAATVAAVPHFHPDDLVTLHPGDASSIPPADEPQVRAILAPGTGTGQGFLHSVGGRHYPLGSEGGHVSFAPSNELEIELLRYLQIKYGRVSCERVLCGSGLMNIYSFLRDTKRASEPDELAQQLTREDPAAVISQAALAGKADIAVQALDIFTSILGAAAGDIMLSYLATGGVYLGGGIPPKILKKLEDGQIVKAYLNKDRLTPAVQKAPLYVIKDDHAAILGAAHIAVDALRD